VRGFISVNKWVGIRRRRKGKDMYITTYTCDICGYKKESDGFPSDWWELIIKEGGLLWNDGFVYEKDCCSRECMKRAIDGYERLASGAA